MIFSREKWILAFLEYQKPCDETFAVRCKGIFFEIYEVIPLKNRQLEIICNNEIAPDVFCLTLGGILFNEEIYPGQFVNIHVPGKSLRRPISVSRIYGDRIDLIYKIVGEGTEILRNIKSGYLDVLLPCGNGFDLSAFQNEILIIGGGMGVAPLFALTSEAIKQCKKVTVIFGFRSPKDAILEEALMNLGVDYHFCFDSEGVNVVTMREQLGMSHMPFAACGPLPMLRALCSMKDADTVHERQNLINDDIYGQLSLEARMGCGFGACMGCSIETKQGMKRICKEGPVFNSKEILWDKI